MNNSLASIIKMFVDFPDDVSVSDQRYDDGSVNLLVKVNQADIGKVIGRGGKIIKAIRGLVKIIAIKNNARLFVNISE